MEARRRELVLGGVLAALLVAVLAAATARATADDDGQASGRITLDAVSVELRHAYASAQPGFFDKSQEDVRVLLSDRPLTTVERTDVFELIHAARDGTATVVEVVIDAERQPISGALYARRFAGQVSAAGMHRFEAGTFSHDALGGRLFVEGPHEFDGVSWRYDATFSATIPRSPTPAQVAAQIASAPGQAAASWLAAVVAGRREPLVALLAPQAAGAWRADFDRQLADARAELAPDSRVVGLARPAADRAVATVSGTRSSDGVVLESTVELVLVDGGWKVTR